MAHAGPVRATAWEPVEVADATSRLATLDDDRLFLTDGGLETVLVFERGLDLPLFATFPMVETAEGRATYEAYLRPYLAIAADAGAGFVLGTLTWRASHGWGRRLGWAPERVDAANRASVQQVVELRDGLDHPAPVVVSGSVGPAGDAYAPDRAVAVEEAHEYHDRQIAVLAAAGVDVVTATTITHVDEAIGIARAAADHDVACVVSFTVETDGRLPSGDALLAAIVATDAATGAGPAHYMVNCAHPTHLAGALDPDDPVTSRIRGIRANASTRSHAELDGAHEIDGGDPDDLGRRLGELHRTHPSLVVLGGCCGTDERHLAAIAAAAT